MEETKTKIEICFFAPTKILAEKAKKIIVEDKLPIKVYVAALDEAVNLARRLEKEGTWLFISRKGTKMALERELGIKVVGVPLEAADYIPIMTQVREEKGLIAIFSYEDISNGLETICYLLDLKIKCYKFTDYKTSALAVQQAVADGAKMGIGGSITDLYAKKYNLKHIIVESSVGSIDSAIRTAMQILAVYKENEKAREALQIKLERFNNILNYTHDAIIAVDDKGLVEVTNKVARNMLSSHEQDYAGKHIDQVLPNTRLTNILESGQVELDRLMDINGTLVSTNRIPIIVNKQIRGVVATFQDIKLLQTAEQNIRIKLHEKGLAAKYTFSDIIGNSDTMKNVKDLAESFANSEFTIMLYGATGTGKELFAQSIHNASPRKDGPFVAINCMSLSKSLLEAELFGYADSSFTGAKKGGKVGLFELAHGGTIFLDEIGDLPIETQAQFLRVLQEKEVRRVGGDKMIPVDIRVIGATNRDLQKCVEAGNFRNDLFYRLNVLNVVLPLLRDREEDYLQIAKAVYKRTAGDKDESKVMRILLHYKNYGWPGNIRELVNVVNRISLLVERNMDEKIILSTLQAMMPFSTEGLAQTIVEEVKDLSLKQLEVGRIKEVLQINNGNVTLTAKQLHISRATLYRKLKEKVDN